MKLCQVNFKVTPATTHPLYWEWETGFLQMWLFAESIEDAGRKAANIIDQLPYERRGDDFDVALGVTAETTPAGEAYDYVRQRIKAASATGIALDLHIIELGGDDTCRNIDLNPRSPDSGEPGL